MKIGMTKIKDLISKYKLYIMIGGIILLSVCTIIALLSVDNNSKIPPVIVDTPEPVQLPSDIDKLEAVIKKVDTTDIDMISTKEFEQADLILDALDIDVDELHSFAGVIDQKLDSIHTIFIARPKDEYYDQVKAELAFYLSDKLNYFSSTGQETKYIITQDSGIYEKNGYIILVLEDYSKEILDSILVDLDKIEDIKDISELTEVEE